MVFDFDEVRQAISESDADSSVYIGADSKVYTAHGVRMVAYVTVIILHYGSSKGARIFRSHRSERFYGHLRNRLMTEVSDAVIAGLEIADSIGDRGFEVHLDVNRSPKYKSSAIIKEATGYVMGTLGIEPKLKPDSFAASSVADRFCVKDAKRKSDRPSMRKKYAKLPKIDAN